VKLRYKAQTEAYGGARLHVFQKKWVRSNLSEDGDSGG